MIDVRGIHASLRIYTHLFRANQIDSSFLFLPPYFSFSRFFIFIFISFFPPSLSLFVRFLVRLFLFELDDFSLVGYSAARTICRRWVSSTQDFVALNCYQPRMTLISGALLRAGIRINYLRNAIERLVAVPTVKLETRRMFKAREREKYDSIFLLLLIFINLCIPILKFQFA